MDEDACGTLQKVLLLTTPRAEDLARLPLEEDPPYLNKLHEEAAVYGAIGVAVVSPETGLWRELGHHPGPAPAWLEALAEATVVPLWRVFLVPDDLAWSRKTWEDHRQQLQPPHEPAYRTWAAERDAIEHTTGGLITKLFMKPRLQKLTRDSIAVLTRRAQARLALALTAYRVKNGRYPATIEELLPTYLRRMPVDPLEGKPLRLHPVGVWRVLYDAQSSPRVEGETTPNVQKHRGDVVFLLREKATE
jgi:hypothetical protein